MLPELIIFDFDGVVADSETIAIEVLAAYVRELGYPLSVDAALSLFVGKRSADVRSIVEELIHRPIPDFEAELLRRTIAAFAVRLKPVKGVVEFIRQFEALPRCIASSSSHPRLQASLQIMNLEAAFCDRIYSVDDVGRGKPFPDVFLHAASCMRADPTNTLVIEDSPGGITAARAAGMTAIGLLAGSHTQSDLAMKLAAAGAHNVLSSYGEIAALLNAHRRAG